MPSKPTQKELKEQFHYDPDTGLFTPRAYIGKQGYALIKVNGMVQRAHRMAFLYITGNLPVNQIDHVNGIKADNRWANLREATNQQNSMNVGVIKSNTSGFKGVSFDKRAKVKKWQAHARIKGVKTYLGHYLTPEEASARYQAVIKALHGEFYNGG